MPSMLARGPAAAVQHRSGTPSYPPGIDHGFRGRGRPWRPASCGTSSPSPRSCTSAAPPQRLGIAQPPLSRAIQQLERRLGVRAAGPQPPRRRADRRRSGAAARGPARPSTRSPPPLAAPAAPAGRDRRSRPGAGDEGRRVPRAAAKLLDAYAAEPGAAAVEVLPVRLGEQEATAARRPRRRGAHAPAVRRPRRVRHRGTARRRARSRSCPPGTPSPPATSSRWPTSATCPTCRSPAGPASTAPTRTGPGPEVRNQTQLAQLIALGRTLPVLPDSGRAWLWPEHVAVPVVDAPHVTTVLAWPASDRSPAVAALVRSAAGLRGD